MEQVQVEHITKNICRLVKCTKNKSEWYIHLLRYEFFTPATWETINTTESNTEFIIREMYFHCLKTPNYNLLIQSLKDCGNHTAAKILEEVYSTNIASSLSCNSPPPKTHNEFTWFDFDPPTELHKTRDHELKTLHKLLEKSLLENTSLMCVYISGLGGMGKSELVKNFVNRENINIKFHCIWINSESNQMILDSFQRLAKVIKVSLMDDQGKDKNLEVLSLEIYKELCKEHCIFVFDNIESDIDNIIFTSLRDYANMLPLTKIKPFCLLMSRHKTVVHPFEKFEHIPLKVLSEEAALSFFLETLEIKENSEIITNVSSICEQLEFFPLTMQLAVSYIKLKQLNDDSETAIETYLDAFDKETQKLLDNYSSQLNALDDYSRTTYLSLQVAFNDIQRILEIDSHFDKILYIISFFHSDNIKIEFVLKILENLEMQNCSYYTENSFSKVRMRKNVSQIVMKIFEALDHYAICHISKTEDKLVSVHRLIQEVIRIHLDEKPFNFLNDLLIVVENMLKDQLVPSTQMVHIVALWKHTKDRKELVERHNKELCELISCKYYNSGKYKEGLDFIRGVLEDLELIMGQQDNRWKLRVMYWNGVFNSSLAEYSTALAILENVYEQQKAFFHDTDDHTLKSAREIGSIHWKLKNLDVALKWTSETLQKIEANYGDEHKETLELKNLLALVLEDQGKMEDALDLHENVLEVRKRVLGSEHQDTLMTKNNIGGIKYSQKKYEDALKIHNEILQVRERVLGNEHPETLNTKNWIGAIVWTQGDHKSALRNLKEVLTAQEKVLGVNHPHTLHTKGIINNINKEIDSEGCIIQ